MVESLVIVLREGLEASLIISIILAFLARMGRKEQFRSIWLGTGLALLASLAAGGVIFLTVGGLEGRPEEIFEGLAMFLVEQNVPLTLEAANRVYIMEKGVVRHHAPAAALRADHAVIHQYLGV